MNDELRHQIWPHADMAKVEAVRHKNRPPCSHCKSQQMQLLNVDSVIPDWVWRCSSCGKLQGKPTIPTPLLIGVAMAAKAVAIVLIL